MQGYAEVLGGFAEASTDVPERGGPSQRIRVSLDASSSPEVRSPQAMLAQPIPSVTVCSSL